MNITTNNLTITHPELIKEWNYIKNGDLKPEQVSYGSEREVWWICENGHEYLRSIKIRTRSKTKNCCKYCNQEKVFLKKEIKKNNGIDKEKNF